MKKKGSMVMPGHSAKGMPMAIPNRPLSRSNLRRARDATVYPDGVTILDDLRDLSVG